MNTATKPAAARIACVGEDDPTYVTQLVRGLEQRAMTARHMSVFSLRLAPRPPDLTVLVGTAAKDGGADVVTQLGAHRGPFALVMAPGALAARLEARQRGLHVLPRAESGDELATLISKLLADIASGATATSTPLPAPAAIALDGLDWDDEHEAATLNQSVPSRPSAPPRAKLPPPPRATLIGGFPNVPHPIRASRPPVEPKPVQPKVEPPKPADVHSAVTRPHSVDPKPNEAVTKSLVAPPSRAEVKTAPPFEEETFVATDASRELARAMNELPSQEQPLDEAPRPTDPDVTAPHTPVFASEPSGDVEHDVAQPEASGDVTTEQDALLPAPVGPSPVAEQAFAPAPVGPSSPAELAAFAPAPVAPRPPVTAQPPAQTAPKRGLGLGVMAAIVALLGLTGAALAAGAYFFWFMGAPNEPIAGRDPALEPRAAPPTETAEPAVASAETAEARPTLAEAPAEPAEPAEPAGAPTESATAESAGTADAAATATAAEPTEPLSPREARAQSDVIVAEGEAHERAGRLAEARDAYARAAEVHHLNPHAHTGLARVALEMGDTAAAVEHAELAVRYRRRRAAYRVLLGDARRAAGDTAGAREAYREALELEPDNREARARLGSAAPAPEPTESPEPTIDSAEQTTESPAP